MMSIKITAGLLLLWFTIPVFADTGKVQYVHDGDTVRISVDGAKIKIRLAGIDAPEMNQEYGLESKAVLKSIIDNKIIYYQSNKKDRYGRVIATLYLDQRMTQSVNAMMVEKGAAWWYKRYARNDKELEQLHNKARLSGAGLWMSGSAIPPWVWRKRK